MGFPFNICAMAEASNFKFGMQLEFAEAHHKITPRGNSGHSLGLGKLPKILVPVSYVLLALAELLVSVDSYRQYSSKNVVMSQILTLLNAMYVGEQ